MRSSAGLTAFVAQQSDASRKAQRRNDDVGEIPALRQRARDMISRPLATPAPMAKPTRIACPPRARGCLQCRSGAPLTGTSGLIGETVRQ